MQKTAETRVKVLTQFLLKNAAAAELQVPTVDRLRLLWISDHEITSIVIQSATEVSDSSAPQMACVQFLHSHDRVELNLNIGSPPLQA